MRILRSAALSLLLVSAIQSGAHHAAATKSTRVPSLTLSQLSNLTYPGFLAPHGKVTLYKGTYSQVNGYDRYRADLFKIHAFGDINGDRVPDAVVTLVENGGGTGEFFTLIAVVNKSGKPVVSGSASLGDRPLLKSLMIARGLISLKMVYAGPKAGACCPDTPTTLTFALRHGKLKLLKQVDEHAITQG